METGCLTLNGLSKQPILRYHYYIRRRVSRNLLSLLSYKHIKNIVLIRVHSWLLFSKFRDLVKVRIKRNNIVSHPDADSEID